MIKEGIGLLVRPGCAWCCRRRAWPHRLRSSFCSIKLCGIPWLRGPDKFNWSESAESPRSWLLELLLLIPSGRPSGSPIDAWLGSPLLPFTNH